MPNPAAGRLSGRIAIVTGAGTGIGQGIAVAMAKQGAGLVIVGRTRETLEDTQSRVAAAGGEARIVQGSIADPEVAERAVAEATGSFGRLDVLVNNGHTFSPPLPLDQTPEADLRQHIESGFFGTYYFMRAAFPHMRERGGSIINFGSMAGVQGWANFAPYAAAKEAIRGLSRVAANEWAAYGIRVNVVCPMAMTPGVAQWAEARPEQYAQSAAKVPLGRFGDPARDVAPIVAFLAGDDARYMTGQTVMADGGAIKLR